MQITVENKGELLRNMSISVPAAEIEEIYNAQLGQLGRTVKVQGFRPGKVPVAVIKQRYGQQVLKDITGEIIAKSMDEAFAKEKLTPAGEPKVHAANMPELGKDYSYSLEFEVYPDVTPKGYEKLKINRAKATPNDKMVNDVLTRLASGSRSYTEKKGKAAKDDRLTIDAEGFLAADNSAIAGSKLNNHRVVVGSGSLIPGFEDALVGLQAGDEKTFDITFPTPYHSKDLEGKAAQFKVKIHTVEKAEEATIDDTFAKNFGMDSLDALKQKITEQLQSDIENASEMKMKKENFDELCAQNKEFAVPQCLIDAEFASLWQAQMNELRQRGLGVSALGKPEDELKVEFKQLAERRVRLGILLTAIARKENIDVSEADVNAEIEKIAAGYGEHAAQVRSFYANPRNRQNISGPLFEKKVVAWLCENGTTKEVAADAEALLEEMA